MRTVEELEVQPDEVNKNSSLLFSDSSFIAWVVFQLRCMCLMKPSG